MQRLSTHTVFVLIYIYNGHKQMKRILNFMLIVDFKVVSSTHSENVVWPRKAWMTRGNSDFTMNR